MKMLKPSRESAVKDSVFKHIESDEYEVLPPPALPVFVWEDLDMDEEDWQLVNPLKAHPKEIFAAVGKAQFEHAIFFLGVADLTNQPEGYALTVETVLRSEEVINAVFKKLDKNLNAVDAGFYVLVGALWVEVFDEEMEDLLVWLRPIFRPLLNKGRAAYREYVEIHGPNKPPHSSSAAGKRGMLASEFLSALHNMQIYDSSPPKLKKTYDYSPKSPDPIPVFDLKSITSCQGGANMKPTTPDREHHLEFYMWADIPSPSGIEQELGLNFEHPINSTVDRGAQAHRILANLSADQNSPQGISRLLPGIQFTKIENVRDNRAGGSRYIDQKPLQPNLSFLSPKAPRSTQTSPRGPLTSRNHL
ncbi:hypothetical protein B0H15DRAFT_237795 [Mycena belliarum]|uniref:Uncharacterized protein n=1 Tax=Mycena belliarum TaxID=1033014 RepID=A0AAD6XVU5_9AGAR|nr:hypothetical protein B0H15DRAFT_237795 [Mycena belliae]